MLVVPAAFGWAERRNWRTVKEVLAPGARGERRQRPACRSRIVRQHHLFAGRQIGRTIGVSKHGDHRYGTPCSCVRRTAAQT